MDYAIELVEQSEQFAALVGDADWSAPVPTCPDWTVKQLVRHVGRGHLWAAQMVRERVSAPLDLRSVDGGRPPEDEAGTIAWLIDAARSVPAAVGSVGADTLMWTFVGPRPAEWWLRRRLHEATVHRADAAMAVGADYALAPAVAADGISEWLDLMVARHDADMLSGSAGLRLTPTDQPSGWTIQPTPDGITWTSEPADVACSVTGPATGLFLALTRRRTAAEAGAQLSGAADVWANWLARTGF